MAARPGAGATIGGFVRAAHALPTVAVTGVMTAFAWILGWSGGPLVLVALAVLLGQLSVGWANDAIDHDADVRAGRLAKPAVRGDVSPRALWIAARLALLAACALSWVVAGWLGGSFHVLALAAAWAYDLRLSRTAWSWLPYAIAFGAMPAFLTVGLDGAWPPWWLPVAFAVTAVAAHLANALPDIDRDGALGLDGLAVRLGARRAAIACWLLLAVGTGVLAIALLPVAPAASAGIAAAYLVILAASRLVRGATAFQALLAVVSLDVAAIAAALAL